MATSDDLSQKDRQIQSHRESLLKTTLRAFREGTNAIKDRAMKLLDKTVESGGFSSSTEARKWLKQNCNRETVQDLYRQIHDSHLSESERKQAMQRMDTLSKGYGFTRQKALEETVRIQTRSIQNAIKDGGLPEMMRVGRDVHSLSMFEAQKTAKIGFKIDEIPTKLINGAIDSKFNATTSVGYVHTVTDSMKEAFIQGLIEGKSTKDIKIAVKDAQGKEQWVSKAFVRTMLTEVSNEVEADSLRDAGFERYEYVCNLDEKTCPVCGRLDGKTFLLKDKQAGVNFPPMHRNCRCTTAPVMTKDAKARMTRKFSLRDEKGRKHYDTVSGDMTYSEWAEKYYPKGAEKVIKEDLKKPKSTITVDRLHPEELAGIKRTVPSMTIDDADNRNANPNYGKRGYDENCQTCVAVYEARRRGYDMEALPKLGNYTMDRVARQTNLVWRKEDGFMPSKTYFHPEDLGVKNTSENLAKWMDETVKEGQRFHFNYKNVGCDWGHIICAERNDQGELMLIDPQCGEKTTGLDAIIKYIKTTVSIKSRYKPALLRVDDKEFNEAIITDIVKKKEKKE